MMLTWDKYVRLEPQYEVKQNPARTISVLPYTIQALQEAGKLLVSERGGLKMDEGGLLSEKSGLQCGPNEQKSGLCVLPFKTVRFKGKHTYIGNCLILLRHLFLVIS